MLPGVLLSSLLWGAPVYAQGIPSAPILSFSMDVLDVEGAEPALIQHALTRRQRMTACYAQGAAPVGQPQAQGEMVLRVRWADSTAEVLAQHHDEGLQKIADCLAHFIEEDGAEGISGEAQATVRYSLRYDADTAPIGMVLGGRRPWEGRAPLVAEVHLRIESAAGVSASALEALLEPVLPAVEACYQQSLGQPGTVLSGQVVVAAQWDRHLTATRVLSHSGGLDRVGGCLSDVVRTVSALEAARSQRRGAEAEIAFDLQARSGTP